VEYLHAYVQADEQKHNSSSEAGPDCALQSTSVSQINTFSSLRCFWKGSYHKGTKWQYGRPINAFGFCPLFDHVQSVLVRVERR
jgi:hypothetical protein